MPGKERVKVIHPPIYPQAYTKCIEEQYLLFNIKIFLYLFQLQIKAKLCISLYVLDKYL